MKLPSSPQEWKGIANEGHRHWNFSNCFGAADGKHIAVLKPKHSGSDFYNYKGFCSVVLLAFADHDYRFLEADIATYFALENNKLNLPDPCRLPLTENNHIEALFHLYLLQMMRSS